MMLSSACCLRCSGFFLLSTLNSGLVGQEPNEKHLLSTPTTPSSAGCWQYSAVFLPLVLKLGDPVQES